MNTRINRRSFNRLAGLGGVAFASGLFAHTEGGRAWAAGREPAQDFYFVQLSDSHWGFKNDAVNPEAQHTLPKAIAEVNALKQKPDFVVFTGDLTQTTEDPQERRKRMSEARDIIKTLNVKTVRFLPGEHDASSDNGAAFKEFFGETHYTFDHKGVHFIVLDNVSDPTAALGDAQLNWLKADLAQLDKKQPIVVLTHRPLFDLAADWDWVTKDGQKAIDMLMPYEHVVVFYGHIHQEHHQMTGHIAHHAATGLMYPLPVAHSQPKKGPVAWDPAQPFKGLGWRSVDSETKKMTVAMTEHPLAKA